MKYNENFLKRVREQYPPGTRIRLNSMDDPYAPIASGTEGTVNFVDDIGTLHCTFDNGRILGVIPGEDSFTVIPHPLQTLKLYMPLTIKLYEHGEYGDMNDSPTELDGRDALEYEDHILAAITKERLPERSQRGLMAYYSENDAVNRKVQSYTFTVEEVSGKLMGVADCRVSGELTAEETELLKNDITGQAADGFGEGLEQRPIQTGEGELYVSLWSSNRSWSIMTQDELEQGQQMGGMQLS